MVIHKSTKFIKVVIHPTVLLGIVDHMNRVVKDNTDERVIGALLGNVRNGIIDVTNYFGVPFTEKPEDNIWVLDVDYVDEMIQMLRKYLAAETVVGWYQTGSRLRLNDILINERFQTINPDVVAVLLDPRPKDLGFPTKAYLAVDETHDDGSPTTKTFQHLSIEIGAEEAEEVGVEHLLRDIGASDTNSLSQSALANLTSLKGLYSYLNDISKYLSDVLNNILPFNSEILEKIQSILYEIPLLVNSDVKNAFMLQNNDDASVTLVSLLVRTVLALNSLINNKVQTTITEQKMAKKEALPAKLVPVVENKDPPSADTPQ
ncbi:hypothetical protein HZS_3639 [Henneguya salminicola]|nr:hypothetical protein HZS_3639 [Henneguya salminicola]